MKLHRMLLLVMAFLVFGTDAGLSAPGDVTVKRGTKGEAYKAAVFPHWVHTIRYRCYACHPAPFKMAKFKMEKGTLKQDRGPYVEPDKSAKDKAKPDEEKEKPDKEKAAPKTDSTEQPAPPAVPVIAVEKAGEATGKTVAPVEESIESKGENEVMHGEQACGLCHNGKSAFLVEFKTCGRCHTK